MSRTLQEQVHELNGILVNLITQVGRLEANYTVLQDNGSANYKALDSFNIMVADPQRFNELNNIIPHSSILKSSIKSDFIATPIRISSKHFRETVSHGPILNTTRPRRKHKREYTSLGISYGTTYDRLRAKGALFPLGPTLDPEEYKRGANWDKDAYCKYHRGHKHKRDTCYPLRGLIQDIIDDGRLLISSTTKKPQI